MIQIVHDHKNPTDKNQKQSIFFSPYWTKIHSIWKANSCSPTPGSFHKINSRDHAEEIQKNIKCYSVTHTNAAAAAAHACTCHAPAPASAAAAGTGFRDLMVLGSNIRNGSWADRMDGCIGSGSGRISYISCSDSLRYRFIGSYYFLPFPFYIL